MAKPKTDPGSWIPVVFVGIFVLSILLTLSIITYTKALQEGCDLDKCVSDNCTIRECIQKKCKVIYQSPFCCHTFSDCLNCTATGRDLPVRYFLNTTFTDAISNPGCTSDVFVQGSILSNANLITQCFSTYPTSRCNSSFSVITVNNTVLADFIFPNNQSYVNIGGLVIENNGTIFYNATNSTINVGSLSINGTLLANTLQSCINSSVTVGGVTFYPNGTVVVSNANAVSVDITGLDSIDILSSVYVQGILLKNGTVQGKLNGQNSNMLLNNVALPTFIAYGKPGPSDVVTTLNINGTLGTTNLIFSPNNCTNVTDCYLDYYYEWSGYANATGITGNTTLDLKVIRIGRNVYFRVAGLASTATGSVSITAVLTNSTSAGLKYQKWLNTSKTVTKTINIWVQSFNTIMYGIASINPFGILRIQSDPYYTFSSTSYYFNTFTMTWTLYS
jgi:hypothetical protein